MSRLPPDSFLPSGAHDLNEHQLSLAGLVSSHPSSVISPLALPRNVNQHLSYFDDRQSHVSRHPSNTSAQVHLQQQQQQQQQRYLSPLRSPPTSSKQRSVSPVRQGQQQHGWVTGSGLVSPSLSPLDNTDQVNLQLRRVLVQNRRLLENWEAERSHLEANRARAEEIYKEERSIMDEDRMIWAETETQLRARIAELERENAILRSNPPYGNSRSSRSDSAVGGVGGSSEQSEMSGVKFRAVPDSTSAMTSPRLGHGYTMPESQPFEPLDPRMQSASPQSSTPGDGPDNNQETIPSIDVQEVHPDLEGIPLRSTAVKKSTFTDGKPPSPPLSSSNVTASNSGSPNSRSKATPAEVTQETLQAPESSRLTMHAGHTPNHSMSMLATAISTNATNTAGSSGTSTPTRGQSRAEDKGQAIAEVEDLNTDGQQDETTAEPEAVFEPSEGDRELTGPLSLRNQPAFDEIFLGKVTDKLQNSIQSDDATPTVLKNGLGDSEEATEQLVPQTQQAALAAAAAATDREAGQSDEPEEVPLKFKANSNFGAPLGTMRSF